MSNPKILVAVPCMDTIDVQFVNSILNMNRVGDIHLELLPGNLVYVSRDILAAKAVESGCDYVFWLDSDMVFPPNILQRLWEHRNKGIVSGLYFRRGAPFNPVLYRQIHIRNSVEDPESIGYDDFPANTLFQVDGIGFGCVLMETKCLKPVFDKYGTCFEPIHSLGEDLSFCKRVQEFGYKIWCHSGIQLGHRYMSISDENTFRAFQQLASGQEMR